MFQVVNDKVLNLGIGLLWILPERILHREHCQKAVHAWYGEPMWVALLYGLVYGSLSGHGGNYSPSKACMVPLRISWA